MKKMCKTCGKIAELLSWEDECYSCKLAKHAEEVKQAVLNGEDTDCKNCADIDEPCGYCRYFGVCVRDDGYCYHGERTEIISERK